MNVNSHCISFATRETQGEGLKEHRACVETMVTGHSSLSGAPPLMRQAAETHEKEKVLPSLGDLGSGGGSSRGGSGGDEFGISSSSLASSSFPRPGGSSASSLGGTGFIHQISRLPSREDDDMLDALFDDAPPLTTVPDATATTSRSNLTSPTAKEMQRSQRAARIAGDDERQRTKKTAGMGADATAGKKKNKKKKAPAKKLEMQGIGHGSGTGASSLLHTSSSSSSVAKAMEEGVGGGMSSPEDRTRRPLSDAMSSGTSATGDAEDDLLKYLRDDDNDEILAGNQRGDLEDRNGGPQLDVLLDVFGMGTSRPGTGPRAGRRGGSASAQPSAAATSLVDVAPRLREGDPLDVQMPPPSPTAAATTTTAPLDASHAGQTALSKSIDLSSSAPPISLSEPERPDVSVPAPPAVVSVVVDGIAGEDEVHAHAAPAAVSEPPASALAPTPNINTTTKPQEARGGSFLSGMQDLLGNAADLSDDSSMMLSDSPRDRGDMPMSASDVLALCSESPDSSMEQPEQQARTAVTMISATSLSSASSPQSARERRRVSLLDTEPTSTRQRRPQPVTAKVTPPKKKSSSSLSPVAAAAVTSRVGSEARRRNDSDGDSDDDIGANDAGLIRAARVVAPSSSLSPSRAPSARSGRALETKQTPGAEVANRSSVLASTTAVPSTEVGKAPVLRSVDDNAQRPTAGPPRRSSAKSEAKGDEDAAALLRERALLESMRTGIETERASLASRATELAALGASREREREELEEERKRLEETRVALDRREGNTRGFLESERVQLAHERGELLSIRKAIAEERSSLRDARRSASAAQNAAVAKEEATASGRTRESAQSRPMTLTTSSPSSSVEGAAAVGSRGGGAHLAERERHHVTSFSLTAATGMSDADWERERSHTRATIERQRQFLVRARTACAAAALLPPHQHSHQRHWRKQRQQQHARREFGGASRLRTPIESPAPPGFDGTRGDDSGVATTCSSPSFSMTTDDGGGDENSSPLQGVTDMAEAPIKASP